MADDKKREAEERIIERLRSICKVMQYGSVVAEFKIHEGIMIAGEIKEQHIKLG
jgi:hypothetical protein